VASGCDSGALVNGRDGKGPEPNQPNTINNSCADSTGGTYHVDESIDRVRILTSDGSPLAAGKTVRIETTVWAFSPPSGDKLDLYYTANATSPAWTFLTTLTPTFGGARTLTTTYTLPAGSLQAVRAQFRYQGAASTCTVGAYNDRDDLAFTVP
jgi:leucyl aminopeptidase